MTATLEDVALISGPSARSRAYAQGMIAAGILPGTILYQPGEEWRWDGPDVIDVDLMGESVPFRFLPNEPARTTFGGADVVSHELTTAPIDDDANLALFADLSVEVLIFSGYRTGILRKAAFDIGKRFLHVHGGYVPSYRGSTTFYYSILSDGMMGASAIWMDSGIDTGPVLARRQYSVPLGIDIDYVLDPLVRADTLVNVLTYRSQRGQWPETEHLSAGDGETFHKIHPVLKHLALRRSGLVQGGHR